MKLFTLAWYVLVVIKSAPAKDCGQNKREIRKKTETFEEVQMGVYYSFLVGQRESGCPQRMTIYLGFNMATQLRGKSCVQNHDFFVEWEHYYPERALIYCVQINM